MSCRIILSGRSFFLIFFVLCARFEFVAFYYGGPSEAEPFFPTTRGPKNSPATLDRNAPAMFKNEECRCRRRPLAPQFLCCWKQPQQSLHPHQKSPSACTTLKLGGARGGLSSNPTYITMFAPHYSSIV